MEIKVPVSYAFNAIRGVAADVVFVVIETTEQACADEWSAYIREGGTVRIDSTMNGKVLFAPKGRSLPAERGPCPSLEERTPQDFTAWMLNPRWKIKEVVK